MEKSFNTSFSLTYIFIFIYLFFSVTDVSKQCSGDECDKAANSCVSITTTISTKNYDRIEVQKFKNQSTSPNIPLCDREDVSKTEVCAVK